MALMLTPMSDPGPQQIADHRRLRCDGLTPQHPHNYVAPSTAPAPDSPSTLDRIKPHSDCTASGGAPAAAASRWRSSPTWSALPDAAPEPDGSGWPCWVPDPALPCWQLARMSDSRLEPLRYISQVPARCISHAWCVSHVAAADAAVVSMMRRARAGFGINRKDAPSAQCCASRAGRQQSKTPTCLLHP
jgi:hypothetical protein